MIVADTSSLISLTIADTLDIFLSEFDVHTTETVIQELEATGRYDDPHGGAATTVLQRRKNLDVHEVEYQEFQSARIDAGETSCIRLARTGDADFIITDDLRALPELEALIETRIAISPIVLKALVQREVLERDDALQRLENLAETRNWLGAPIYRRARHLFDTDRPSSL